MHRVTIFVNCLLGLVACGYCFDFPEPPNYGWGYQTDLDKYVNADDGYFSWTLLSTTYLEDSVFYVLNMTSQKWVEESFCSRAIWWHFMGIAVPNRLIRDDIAIIYQKGGTNEEEPPTADAFESTMAIRCAEDTGTVCAYVKQVPNQPIVFYNDPSLESRVEDQIIAWSWVSFGATYDTPEYNPALPLRNPMTKAVKRGMDAVNEFVKTILPDSNINKFLVTGISKRGWTAWSTAMTDRRVIAIIPMVFSLLHMEESVMNHYKALENKWSFALQPYWQENLTQFMLEPLAWGPGGLYDFEDIYRYRSRLNIPKLSIGATGDEFFFPQDFHAWWVNMTGIKLLRMLPNADHIMVSHYMDMYDTEIAFYEFILKDGGTSLPTLTWSRSETTTGAELILQANPPPRINPETGEYDVQTWIAVTHPDDTRRDFRLVTADGAHNVRWENYTTEALSTPGLFRSVVDRNLDGEWVGHFIEATWTSPSGRSLTLTTEVNYLPYETYPGVACTNQEECYGALV